MEPCQDKKMQCLCFNIMNIEIALQLPNSMSLSAALIEHQTKHYAKGLDNKTCSRWCLNSIGALGLK